MAAAFFPVILSGGAGTRLWPVSRAALPKPFLRLPDPAAGEGGRSLLRQCVARALALPDAGAPWVVTNRDYYFLSRDELAGVAGAAPRYLLETAGRNTAPAILLATLAVADAQGEDACLLVLPADHLIRNLPAFADAVARARALAAQGWLVTFGIEPTAPATGYGYIRAGDRLDGGHAVRQFVEKPDRARAQQYLADGGYFWNSGMFCFRAADMRRAFETLNPELYRAGLACWQASRERAAMGGDGVELDRATFDACESISIDYAIFEHAPKVAVVPCDLGWTDVGAWDEVAAQYPADAQGNRSASASIFADSAGCFVHAQDRLVALLGLTDVYVVDTPDALLVLDKTRAQDVKKIVDEVRRRGGDKHAFHVTVARPWGSYTLLQEAPGFKIKRIEVKPGRSLSLQMHYHRSEHWIVVSGTADVVNGERRFLVRTNESTYIPAGTRHRLSNPGKLPLVMIEVQSGGYVGEDDIVRYDDDYGRA